MKIALIVLACVAAVMCDDPVCGPLQRLKVRHQWIDAYGSNARSREQFGREIWDYIFEHDPKLKELLTRVRGDNLYSAEFDAHMIRVLGGLDMCIALLGDEDTLNSQLAHLKEQHAERGVTADNFKLFEHALDHALPLHTAFFDQDAWDSCFRVISNGINA